MDCNGRIHGSIPGDLPVGEDGVEPLGIEVMEQGIMAVLPEGTDRCIGDGMVEAPRARVAEDNGDFQGFTPLPLKKV
jgi:hypothetical protein